MRLLILGVLLFAGCPAAPVVPDAPAPPWSETRVLDSLALEAEGPLTLPRGEAVQLSLMARFAEQPDAEDVSAATTWFVGDEKIAGVLADGRIEALNEGVTAVWGVYAGVPSEPLALEVVRGRWNVVIEDGESGVQGKLLELEISSPDTSFDSAEEVVLTVDGLLPFGMERVVEPWWGVPAGQPSRYRARFLVPPTAAPVGHDLVVTLDGRAPENSAQVQITSNTAFGEVRGCDYFASEPASNWSFQVGGNNARTWLFGGLGAGSNTRILASNNGDAVDPWLGLWSLTGELLASSDTDPEFGNDGAAGLQLSSLEDVFEGAYYVTAAISPMATGAAQGGTLVTDCSAEEFAGPRIDASNDLALFGAGGTNLLPGQATADATFVVGAGTVSRVWAYVDATLAQPDFTTLTLVSASGTSVELISPQWSADWLGEQGSWRGALGGPSPFVPVAEVWVNPSNPGPGTAGLAGEAAAGTWSLSWDVQAAGSGGLWRDAALFIELQ